MMRSMFGIRYIAPSGLSILLLYHFIGLPTHSPKGATYICEAVTPLAAYFESPNPNNCFIPEKIKGN